MPQSSAEFRRNLAVLLALLVTAAAVFSIWPGIDLWVAARFYDGAGVFAAETSRLGQTLRYLVWDLSIVMFCAAVVLWVAGLFGRRVRGIGPAMWGFIALLFLLGPVLLSDTLLKEYWGRARPASVADFGGDRAFTPFWDKTDQCAANCSFVSGEASGAAALAIALMVLAPALTRGWPGAARAGYVAAAVGLPLAAIAQRVAAGRHFLSDVVFAALFVALIALVLHRILLRGR